MLRPMERGVRAFHFPGYLIYTPVDVKDIELTEQRFSSCVREASLIDERRAARQKKFVDENFEVRH